MKRLTPAEATAAYPIGIVECLLQALDELDDATAAVRQWWLGEGPDTNLALGVLLVAGLVATGALLGAGAMLVSAAAVVLSATAALSLRRRFAP